jgi:ribosomal protein S12 methylthiotransferase
MAQEKILPYLDMPLQHASPELLRAMKRPAATEKVLDRLARWRLACPELVVRSTFIVGFPGETETQFNELLDFLREARLDRVGCFPYSPVEGAPANALPSHVPETQKQERLARFMEVQKTVSREKLQARVGGRMVVLVDEIESEAIIARSPADAPEIDGNVILERGWDLEPGDFVEVEVTCAGDHDLWARPITEDD